MLQGGCSKPADTGQVLHGGWTQLNQQLQGGIIHQHIRRLRKTQPQ